MRLTAFQSSSTTPGFTIPTHPPYSLHYPGIEMLFSCQFSSHEKNASCMAVVFLLRDKHANIQSCGYRPCGYLSSGYRPRQNIFQGPRRGRFSPAGSSPDGRKEAIRPSACRHRPAAVPLTGNWLATAFYCSFLPVREC